MFSHAVPFEEHSLETWEVIIVLLVQKATLSLRVLYHNPWRLHCNSLHKSLNLPGSLKGRHPDCSEFSCVWWQYCIHCPNFPYQLKEVKVKPELLPSMISHVLIGLREWFSDELTVTSIVAFLKQRGADKIRLTELPLVETSSIYTMKYRFFLGIVYSHSQVSLSVHSFNRYPLSPTVCG